MGEASAGLLRLRPVTFRYKRPYGDGSKQLDYGLIAEDVAEVYPDLVVNGEDGQVETVQYQKLTPMLLNEVQKQHAEIQEQAETIRQLQARLAAMEALLTNKTTPAGQ
jgi:Chaperone of endosialidase